MNDEAMELKMAHAVFDLPDIPRQKRNNPLSLWQPACMYIELQEGIILDPKQIQEKANSN